MALNIKDPTTDRLARELAAITGQPITTAIREAIEDKLALAKAKRSHAETRGLSAIIERGRARTMLDERAAEEILGYDEDGLPT